MSYKTAVIDNCLNLLVVATLIVDGGMGVAAELITLQLTLQKTMADVMPKSRTYPPGACHNITVY